MKNRKTTWIIILIALLAFFIAMFFIGLSGMDKQGVYVPRII